MWHPELTYKMRAGATMTPVRKLLAERGEPLPNPVLSCAFTAENPDGKIIALSLPQSVLMVEPFKMLDPNYNGGEVLNRLFEMTKEFILESECPRVLMHTSHSGMMGMLRMAGAYEMVDRFFDWRRQSSNRKAE